jgi:hypothetical protein
MHPRLARRLLALSVAVHVLLVLESTRYRSSDPAFRAAPAAGAHRAAAAAAGRSCVRRCRVALPPGGAKPIVEPPPQHRPRTAAAQPLLPEQQIVSPPDAGKNEAPPETRLLSDRDNRVDQQTAGMAPAPGEESPGKRTARRQRREASQAGPKRGGERAPPPRVASLPGLDRLLPDAPRLAE